MNLPYTLSLLIAAKHNGIIKLYGAAAEQELRGMAAAGLVDATFNNGKPGSSNSIDRVLDAGETFVRVFTEKPLPKSVGGLRHIASGRITLAEWGRSLQPIPPLRLGHRP